MKRKILTREEWIARKRRKRLMLMAAAFVMFLLIVVLIVFIVYRIYTTNHNNDGMEQLDPALTKELNIQTDYLTPNPYSRPQTRLQGVEGVVVHYTANPGTSAANNRSYFEGLANKHTTYASSHYIIGLEGEVLQIIPLTEVSYASNERNDDTVAIECCIPDETGKFSDATYTSAVTLTAALCIQFDLKEKDILRHYDITGKNCPKYFVEHEDAWEQFLDDVMAKVKQLRSSYTGQK